MSPRETVEIEHKLYIATLFFVYRSQQLTIPDKFPSFHSFHSLSPSSSSSPSPSLSPYNTGPSNTGPSLSSTLQLYPIISNSILILTIISNPISQTLQSFVYTNPNPNPNPNPNLTIICLHSMAVTFPAVLLWDISAIAHTACTYIVYGYVPFVRNHGHCADRALYLQRHTPPAPIRVWFGPCNASTLD